MVKEDGLRTALRKIDKDETIEVTDWEANFIESVVYQYDGFMSEKQKAICERIIDKYERR